MDDCQEEHVGRLRSPKEDGNHLREYKDTHEEHFLISWLSEGVEGEKVELEKSNEEATQEESQGGKREVEGDRGRLENKENLRATFAWPSFLRALIPFPRWRVLGFPLGCRCVPDLPPSVPDVTVPISSVNGIVNFLHDSDCEFVELQTLSLSRKRDAFL